LKKKISSGISENQKKLKIMKKSYGKLFLNTQQGQAKKKSINYKVFRDCISTN